MPLPFRFELLPIVLEQVTLEAVERDRLQETRRDDPVGVDVISPKRDGTAAIFRIFSIGIGHLPDVDDLAGNRRRGHHRRTHKERPPGRAPLTALEIAVRR